MTTTKIKCACGWKGCKARIEISEENVMNVYDEKYLLGDATVLLPRPIAKAIRDACKVMDENDVDH